jgi:outer membrane protein assembly factor BamE (lipoprotein component of BamABCDE complex)
MSVGRLGTVVAFIFLVALSGCRKSEAPAVKDKDPAAPPSTPTPEVLDLTRVQPSTDKSTAPPTDPAGNKAEFTRDQFKSLFIGRSKEELVKRLGEPNSTGKDGDDEYWHYHERTQNPADGSLDDDAMVTMRKGVVLRITFKPRD